MNSESGTSLDTYTDCQRHLKINSKFQIVNEDHQGSTTNLDLINLVT